jgi:hypothetical protein
MRGWRHDDRQKAPSNAQDEDSYFEEGTTHKTSAINFAQQSYILSKSKYGLPELPARYGGKEEDDEEDPLDAYMKQIERQAQDLQP